MEWVSHVESRRFLSTLERQYLGDKSFGLFVDGSFGDVFLCLAYLDSFRATHNGDLHVFISERYMELAKIYVRPWLRFLFLPESSSIRELIRHEIGRRGHHLLAPGMLYPTLPTMHPLLAEGLNTRRISDPDVRTLILGLPKDANFSFPGPNSDQERLIHQQLSSLGVDLRQSVIFSPVTNTIKSFNLDYIELILQHLSKSYSLIINTSEASHDLNSLADRYGVRYSIPPHGIFEASRLVGKHVAITSGLAYLLAIFQCACDLVHVIPSHESGWVINNNMRVPSSNCSFFAGHTCQPVNNVKELWLPPDDLSLVQQRLLSWDGFG